MSEAEFIAVLERFKSSRGEDDQAVVAALDVVILATYEDAAKTAREMAAHTSPHISGAQALNLFADAIMKINPEIPGALARLKDSALLEKLLV